MARRFTMFNERKRIKYQPNFASGGRSALLRDGPCGTRPGCRVEPMPARKVDYLLIGGGLASGNCARWLRESGAEGSILIVGREPDPPYNRPPCSKGYLVGKESREDTLFRPPDWYEAQQVGLLTRTSVMKLDLEARTVTLSNREQLGFDKALVATGANVRRLTVTRCQREG